MGDDPRGVWGTMGPVRVEGPGITYLRAHGLTAEAQMALRARSKHPNLDAELERCGRYWRKREPLGVYSALAAAERWLANARFAPVLEKKAAARERTRLERKERLRELERDTQIERARIRKITSDRQARAENHEAQAADRWQARTAE